MKNSKPRITVRLQPEQLQVLCELKNALGCNIALIVRAIIGDFLTRNEDILERIISEYEETHIPLRELEALIDKEEWE